MQNYLKRITNIKNNAKIFSIWIYTVSDVNCGGVGIIRCVWVFVCINACFRAKNSSVGSWHTTHLFMPQIKWQARESKGMRVTTKNAVLVRTWKREMAVSRRYNNVTLYGNVLLCVSICFSFFLAFVSFHSSTLPQCLRLLPSHIHFWICVCVRLCVVSVCMRAYVLALWNVIQIKRMRVSCSKIPFVIFFFILFLIFVFVSLFFHTHTH